MDEFNSGRLKHCYFLNTIQGNGQLLSEGGGSGPENWIKIISL